MYPDNNMRENKVIQVLLLATQYISMAFFSQRAFLVKDDRVLNLPLGRSLRSFARTAHSAHSLHSAPLRYARFARSLCSQARSLAHSLPHGTVEILEYVFAL